MTSFDRNYGESSSVGRASGCGSEGRGFDPHLSPQASFIRGFRLGKLRLADAILRLYMNNNNRKTLTIRRSRKYAVIESKQSESVDMDFNLTPTLFLGTFFIAWGISMILKTMFGIDLALGKTVIAIFLIYVGMAILLKPKSIFTFKKTFVYTNSDGNKTERHVFTVGDDEEQEKK